MNVNSELFGIGFQQNSSESRRNSGESIKMLQDLIKFCHQIFARWQEQTIWNLLKNVWFIQRNVFWVEKTVQWVEIQWLSGKEKVMVVAVNEESILGHEKTHLYWFPWKKCHSNHCFLLPTPLAKFSYIYRMIIVYILGFLWLLLSLSIPYGHGLWQVF